MFVQHVRGLAPSLAGLPATSAGYRELLLWARSFGGLPRAGVEGTGSYGAALTRHLLSHGIQVFDVNRPDKTAQRQQGTTDTVDAQAAARAVLSGRATTHGQGRRRAGADRAHVQAGKGPCQQARTQAINLASGGDHHGHDDVLDATLITLQLPAERLQQLTAQGNEPKQRLAALVQSHAPQLLERNGVGPDSAVTQLPLNLREWTYAYGAVHDRAVNAAHDILAAGLAVSACGDDV